MKRILLALTIAGLLLPLVPRAQADPEVSLNFFYDNLSPYGNWIDVADYGYCFQPNVALSNSDWRPYADGYWAYTDAGWTWVSYEDFGWATYHYGRWANLDSYGWVWVPGYEWGPAWVSWRTGGDYVGWAPLPPLPGGVVYEGRAITGAVDVVFGIGPLYYNFVDIRYLGEPVLRGRLIAPRRNVTIINRTVNVTNITVNKTIVINNGPDLNRVNEFSARPIKRYTLQRETNLSASLAGRRGNLNRVNGDSLMVAAPAVQRSQQPLAPRQVKARVDAPKIEKGWRGISNRQQVEQEMKKENAQNVPPPSFPAHKGIGAKAAEPNANASLGRRPGHQVVADDATTDLSGMATKVESNGEQEKPAQLQGRGIGQPQPGQNTKRADKVRRPQEAVRAERPRPAAQAQGTPPNRHLAPAQPAQQRAIQSSQQQPGEQQKKKKKPEDQPPGR